uniref:Probable zinc-ribbon domain-containing protein n=1 Tax=Leersia perrieri TaxID=77586 RepID=A0A0D9V312_9ORYZ
MGSDLKEMKYRRRIGLEERAQCSEQRTLDWRALKQDPVELLRKLDELREQITRSCQIVEPPGEHRRTSRRTLSLLPENPEPPPMPGYHRSRYGGRYGHGLPPSPYETLRPELGERYSRQSSGRYRQYQGRQWDNCGVGHGNYNPYACSCPHCLHGHKNSPQEEHIPMARYFAGQQECYRFERSPSVSSDYDRRSVASSLYSHRSVSKKRAEYFRKKAEHLCRPVHGAAPFVVCSSCYQLLQVPMEKCMGRNRLQCGSCSQVISLKHEEKVIPFSPPASFCVSKTDQCSNDQTRRDFDHQLNDFANSAFYNLNEHSSMQINIDFGDNHSVSSSISHDTTEEACGSSRSIQLKTDGLLLSPNRSGDIESPKDILCERDAGCQVQHSDVRISPCSPVLEDKLVDPLCRQKKDNTEDLSMADISDVNCKGELKVNNDDGIISMESEQKGKECDEVSLVDESMCKTHEQKSKEDHCSPGGEVSKMHELDSIKDDISSLIDGNENHDLESKQDDTNSLEGEGLKEEYEQMSKEDDNSGLEGENVNKGFDENNKENDNIALEDANTPLEDTRHAFDSASLSGRCEEKKTEEENGKSDQSFVEDGNAFAESGGSSFNERTNSGFSRGSSETALEEDQPSTGKSGDSSFFAGFLKKGFKDLSLFNQSMDSVKVSINGHPISERALKKAEKKAGPVEPGSYWYDYRAGFWGVMGRECIGIIPPFIREFNYPMASNCATGDTGVFVNGRELHQRDLDLLVGRGLPRTSGKSYSVEISGNVTDEATGKKLRSLGKLAPTIEKLKRGFGMHVPEEFR